MGKKCFVIDIGRCTGCYNCQLACKDEHAGNDFRPVAAPQPMTGQFWIKVHEHIGGTIPKVRMHYEPRLCNHCDNPACMAACPAEAITRREDGLVILWPDKCIGCRACVSACPYEAIYFNDKDNIAQKCTGCAHLLDAGEPRPRCVEACPTDALRFGDEEELRDLIADAKTLEPLDGCGPRVYYRNRPGRFLAGTIYDPVEKEVIIGGTCTLTSGDKTWNVTTDDFGDFWFRDLPAGRFRLEIQAQDFRPIVFDDLDVSQDRNLGDLPMDRA